MPVTQTIKRNLKVVILLINIILDQSRNHYHTGDTGDDISRVGDIDHNNAHYRFMAFQTHKRHTRHYAYRMSHTYIIILPAQFLIGETNS